MASVPDDVRRFVLTSIPSVPYLEAALLLHRRADASCSAGEVARALYLPESKARELLDELAAAGLAGAEAGAEVRYRYAPRDAALAAAIDRLALAYAADLVGIARLIHDSTLRSAQRFADAFRLRREP